MTKREKVKLVAEAMKAASPGLIWGHQPAITRAGLKALGVELSDRRFKKVNEDWRNMARALVEALP